MITLKPLEERTVDSQYRELLLRILDEGEWMPSAMDEDRKTVFGHRMEFDLRNGAPILTERDIVTANERTGRSIFSMGTAEIIAFMNGARTHEELVAFGCPWWKPWVSEKKCAKRGLETGDLGPGSYGPAYRSFPTEAVWDEKNKAWKPGEPFDQIKALLRQMQERPELRTHQATPFVPQYSFRLEGEVQKVVVVPCHGDMMWRINHKTGHGTYIHTQWSCDAPVGLAANLFQHGFILPWMFSVATGITFDKVVYLIKDVHIYRGQLKDVKDILSVKPQLFPTVSVDPEITDFFAFRAEHFSVLSDYNPQLPPRRIITPI